MKQHRHKCLRCRQKLSPCWGACDINKYCYHCFKKVTGQTKEQVKQKRRKQDALARTTRHKVHPGSDGDERHAEDSRHPRRYDHQVSGVGWNEDQTGTQDEDRVLGDDNDPIVEEDFNALAHTACDSRAGRSERVPRHTEDARLRRSIADKDRRNGWSLTEASQASPQSEDRLLGADAHAILTERRSSIVYEVFECLDKS